MYFDDVFFILFYICTRFVFFLHYLILIKPTRNSTAQDGYETVPCCGTRHPKSINPIGIKSRTGGVAPLTQADKYETVPPPTVTRGVDSWTEAMR